jgi:RNA polymerase sigma-70 factor, ECF subfamily
MCRPSAIARPSQVFTDHVELLDDHNRKIREVPRQRQEVGVSPVSTRSSSIGSTVAGGDDHVSRSVGERDDEELIDLFRTGEVSAFEELYRRHHPVVLRRLTRLCGNEAIAEELAQEAFLRAAQRITVTGELRFRAWVMRIGTNLGIDHLRALRRHPSESIDESLGFKPAAGTMVTADTEVDVERREDARFVAAVLNRLRPRHRQVLVLREIEGLDYKTIAERLGVSTSAVETLLFRARGRFREEYAKAMALAA